MEADGDGTNATKRGMVMECTTFDRHGETRKETNNQMKVRI